MTKTKLGKFYLEGKFFLLAVDGSEKQTPRTGANAKRFGAKSNKKKPAKRKRNAKNNKIVNIEKREKAKRQSKRKKQSKKDRDKKAETPLVALILSYHLTSII